MPPPSTTEVLARACCLAACVRRLSLEIVWRTPKEDRGQWAQSHRAAPRRAARPTGVARADEGGAPVARETGGPPERRRSAQRGLVDRGRRRAGLGAGTGRGASRVRPDVRAGALQDILQAPSGNTLRPAEVLGRARDEAERWHRRSNQTQGYFRIPGTVSGPMEVAYSIRAHRASRSGSLSERTSRSTERRIRSSPARDFSLHRSIAIERHRALRWLCDGGEWDAEVLEPMPGVPRESSAPPRAAARCAHRLARRDVRSPFRRGHLQMRRGWSAASSCSSAEENRELRRGERLVSAPERGRRPSSRHGARRTRTS